MDIAAEWYYEQIGTSFSLDSNDTDNNAVMYYSCYLASIAQNGMGIERIQVGDLAVYYEGDQFIHFKELAEQELVMKQSLSIKTTTYNADPWLGDVNWNKNVTGVDSTKNIRKVPRGINYKEVKYASRSKSTNAKYVQIATPDRLTLWTV